MESVKTAPVDNQGRSAAASSKKRGAGIRAWLVIDSSGRPKLEEFEKHRIMRRTGLPARDLRILDPLLSYPSRILARERAIVVNLEHIKAIITAAEVLLLNSKDPLVAPFVRDLQSRISSMCCSSPSPEGTESAGATLDLIDKHTLCSVRTVVEPTLTSPPRARNSGRLQVPYKTCGDLTSMILPFEFRVLEVCLESLCRCLESETSTLEQEAYPVLDELTCKISTLNLERVRQIKSRLVAISGRVQKVRDELEHLLDDDTHMAEMYLTNKAIHQEVDETSNDDLENDGHSLDNERDQDPNSTNDEMRNINESSSVTKLQIEELEMLLEAYFVQIDGTLNKLSVLREYVDDTEDYINIMLDDKQNQLLHMGVLINIATLLITMAVVVTGIFGMNIKISLFKTGTKEFLQTTVGTLGGTLVLYFIAMGWGRKKLLLG
ncbi:magnesium transporter MRS2-F-like [Nymphaea colorata]|nr:magnesium transporter MRS2-F-like [Nymphaea colorata]